MTSEWYLKIYVNIRARLRKLGWGLVHLENYLLSENVLFLEGADDEKYDEKYKYKIE